VTALYTRSTFAARREREWKLIKDNLTENTLALEAELFADGDIFPCDASDRLANPPRRPRGRTGQRSCPTGQHTAPRHGRAPRRTGGQVEAQFEATMAASPLRSCRILVGRLSLDPPWRRWMA
jgi:hypothetical protein